jgi:hypothetical protein
MVMYTVPQESTVLESDGKPEWMRTWQECCGVSRGSSEVAPSEWDEVERRE